jgi:transcription elongation factor Elf1
MPTGIETIRFTCPTCGEQLSVPVTRTGQPLRCVRCDGLLRVPVTAQSWGHVPIKIDPGSGLPVGGRDECPRCGSGDVRTMTPAKARQFYGRKEYVPERPRVCKNCRHEWEVLVTKERSKRYHLRYWWVKFATIVAVICQILLILAAIVGNAQSRTRYQTRGPLHVVIIEAVITMSLVTYCFYVSRCSANQHRARLKRGKQAERESAGVADK